jgi:hypothetical protein
MPADGITVDDTSEAQRPSRRPTGRIEPVVVDKPPIADVALNGPYESRFTIPANVVEAIHVLTGLGALLTARQWVRAMIVYAFTRDSRQGRNGSSTGMTCMEFAELGITGLRSDRTVRNYRNAYRWAIERGAPDVGPGDNAVVPDQDWDAAIAAVAASADPAVDDKAHRPEAVPVAMPAAMPDAVQSDRPALDEPLPHEPDPPDTPTPAMVHEEVLAAAPGAPAPERLDATPAVNPMAAGAPSAAAEPNGPDRILRALHRYAVEVAAGRAPLTPEDRQALALIRRLASGISNKTGVPEDVMTDVDRRLGNSRPKRAPRGLVRTEGNMIETQQVAR